MSEMEFITVVGIFERGERKNSEGEPGIRSRISRSSFMYFPSRFEDGKVRKRSLRRESAAPLILPAPSTFIFSTATTNILRESSMINSSR